MTHSHPRYIDGVEVASEQPCAGAHRPHRNVGDVELAPRRKLAAGRSVGVIGDNLCKSECLHVVREPPNTMLAQLGRPEDDGRRRGRHEVRDAFLRLHAWRGA